MPLPPRVVKYTRNGIQYTSSVDRAQYTLQELTRAALREVGIFVSRECNKRAMRLPGMRKSKRVRGRSSAFGYWVRKRETDLQVGIKHDTWYGVDQELGSKKQPQRQILRNAVNDNIAQIVEIESQYLSALESEAEALKLIDEEEFIGGADDE